MSTTINLQPTDSCKANGNNVYIIKNGSGTAMWRRKKPISYSGTFSYYLNCFYRKRTYPSTSWGNWTRTANSTTVTNVVNNMLAGDSLQLYFSTAATQSTGQSWNGNYSYYVSPSAYEVYLSDNGGGTIATLTDDSFASISKTYPTVFTFSAPTSVTASYNSSSKRVTFSLYNGTVKTCYVMYRLYSDGEILNETKYTVGLYPNTRYRAIQKTTTIASGTTRYGYLDGDDGSYANQGYKIIFYFRYLDSASFTGDGTTTTMSTECRSSSASVEINGYTSETTTA